MNEDMGFLNTKLELSHRDFVENPNARQQFKLVLNSMLGKLAQKPLSEYSRFISDKKELDKVALDVSKIHTVTDNFCHISQRLEGRGINTKGNCVVYAFITARNRITLHKNMAELVRNGFELYYCDCDSIIFAGTKERSLPIPVGLSFGDFKEELGREKKIKHFYCLGRKQFKICVQESGSNKEEHFLKVKGISLSSEMVRKKVLNAFPEDFSTIEKLEEKEIEVPQLRRIQNSCEKQIFHIKAQTNCQRKQCEDVPKSTLPWGFIE